ncbi:glycosyltransferase involved in cell wall biosynthesis [Desulfobaculum xiamenense]|uniref:Glycosyltransferase involved in cell wall biosynthesis n=1 Tax=Desulfobaculum xiamenense TaxID=995050 RepID=A0A846QPW8_9BACT|nr:glycosyltransferase [Desulfobaculum xiamenense]NJB69227.1 glycosyltransferase involved in cell wall biosynthesis [Desulfobaculum xiamenense]
MAEYPSSDHSQRPATVASVTPLPLSRDSRTMKQAATVARLSLRSVVVEGAPGLPLPQSLGLATRTAVARPDTGRGALAVASRYLWRLGAATYRATPPDAALYHLHAPYQFPAVYARARRTGAPIVYDAHDFYTAMERPDAAGMAERLVLHPLLARLEAACVRHCAALITVCDGLADLYRERYGREATVIRNCHDARLDVAPSTGIRDACDVGPDVFLVAVIGQAKAGRPTDAALAALTALPEHAHIALLGRGHEAIATAARMAGLAGRVHALPPVAPWEVVPFVCGANASLILYTPISQNYRFSLPNALFQSLAAGLPLLYPDLPEIRAVAEPRHCGLVIDPTDSAGIASALARIMDDAAHAASLREAATRAGHELSWAAEESRLSELYARLLGGSP